MFDATNKDEIQAKKRTLDREDDNEDLARLTKRLWSDLNEDVEAS